MDQYQSDNRPRRFMARESFRFWAFVGGLETYKKLIVSDIISRERYGSSGGISKPTEQELLRIEERYDVCKGALDDLSAVEEVWKQLDAMPDGTLRRRFIHIVCCEAPEHRLARSELSQRVIAASVAVNISEATAWRWLARTCDMYAANRGLRL